jgi:hypothetical protein
MSESANPFSSINFGLLIAYFLPGFIGLNGLRPLSGSVAIWFEAILDKDKSLGASFLILSAALVTGLIISACRDIMLERLHYATGVKCELFDYGKFIDKDKRAVLQDLIANKYRYYQFYGNTLVASFFLLVSNLLRNSILNHKLSLTINFAVCVLLFMASREALTDMFNTYKGIVDEIDTERDRP